MAAKTWTGQWWKYGGGGTVWDSMAYDAELDLLYIGVGNGSPWDRDVRSPKGGDNLFLSSIVAVRPDTGEVGLLMQVLVSVVGSEGADCSLLDVPPLSGARLSLTRGPDTKTTSIWTIVPSCLLASKSVGRGRVRVRARFRH